MRKAALLMLCAGFGASVQVSASPNDGDAYPAQVGYGVPAISDGAMFEILGRFEQLQSEVQQLRGLVEEQAQTISDLERKQSHMYSDLDDRLQNLSASPAATNPQANSVSAQVATNGVTAGTAGPSAPTQAAAAVTPVAVPPAVASTPQSSPTNSTNLGASVGESKPAGTISSSTPSQGNEKERYQQAYDTLRNGHNLQAIKMFEDLLVDQPTGEFADNAQYWLAEALKINRDYDKARAAFSKVVSQYPNSSKVPDALLKLGFIELEQQNVAKGRDYLTRIVTNFPGTTAAHLASKKLGQMPQ
jgi:tol-pal system protein YbgF